MVDGPEQFPGGEPQQFGQQDRRSTAEWAVEQAERERSFQLARYEQNILTNSTKPEAVRWAIREIARRYESVTVRSPQLDDRFGLVNVYHGLRSRAQGLRVGSNHELVTFLGLEEDGLVGHRFKAIEVDPSITDPEERKKEAQRLLKEPESLTSEQIKRRDKLIEELDRAGDEMEVREKWDELWGLYVYVQGNFKDMNKISFVAENRVPVARDWQILFNLPATAEAEWVVPSAQKEKLEGKLGERIDLGIRLYMIAALSERPTELERIRQTPGYKEFVAKPLKQALIRFGEKINNNELEDNPVTRELKKLIAKYKDDPDIVEKVFIGDVASWKSEEARLVDGPETELQRLRNRGLLTLQSNIFARKEKWSQKEFVSSAITQILGGDESAQELAKRVFSLCGFAPYYGIERDAITRDSQGNIIKQEIDREGAPYSDARERAMDLDAYMRYKQTSDEWAGPDSAIGKYPKRLLTDMFKHISITDPSLDFKEDDLNISEEDEEKRKWEQTKSQRSLWEVIWEGWDGEHALRLGDIPWERLNSYFWKDYTIRIVFATQLFDLITANPEAWDFRSFTSLRFWREFGTALRVSLGNWVVPEEENMFGWKEWLGKNKQGIEEHAKDLFKGGETKTPEGAMDKAAKAILKEQGQKIKDRVTTTLYDSIRQWYPYIEPRPMDRGSLTEQMTTINEQMSKANLKTKK